MLVPYDVIAKGVAWQHTRLRTHLVEGGWGFGGGGFCECVCECECVCVCVCEWLIVIIVICTSDLVCNQLDTCKYIIIMFVRYFIHICVNIVHMWGKNPNGCECKVWLDIMHQLAQH